MNQNARWNSEIYGTISFFSNHKNPAATEQYLTPK